MLAERAHWLTTDEPCYAAEQPGTVALIRAAVTLASSAVPGLPPASTAAELGRVWAPDFLLLAPDAAGRPLLQAGCVCFPSHWDLRSKMGQPLAAIHAPVPSLNAGLGRQIDGFLQALRPGTVWERWNWGLAATAERNNHPARNLPRLSPTTPLASVWLRFEHQAFLRLAGGGVLFGIRIVSEPLLTTLEDPAAAARLAALLATMPAEVAAYKGFGEPVRSALLEAIGGD